MQGSVISEDKLVNHINSLNEDIKGYWENHGFWDNNDGYNHFDGSLQDITFDGKYYG